MRLARRYGSGVVPTQQPTRGPGTDAVDFAAFTPIAAWVCGQQMGAYVVQ